MEPRFEGMRFSRREKKLEKMTKEMMMAETMIKMRKMPGYLRKTEGCLTGAGAEMLAR